MRRTARTFLGFFMLALAAPARGDGGTLRLSERAGPYRVSVFTDPEPLRVGSADVSVLVQEAGSGAPVADAVVRLTLRPAAGDGAVLSYTATAEQAVNKLLRAAAVEFPAAGPWRIAVDVEGPRGPARCAVEVHVATPLPRWRQMWPWFSWPAVPIVLFVLHQLLRQRGRGRPAAESSPHDGC
jgi:hypothetical protein